jgi:tetratricopeptide (TPR) repeat protein
MKKTFIYAAFAALLLAAGTVPAWGQASTLGIKGKVTQNGKPLANVQVVLTRPENGKTLKTKTDKNGEFILVGVELAKYEVTVLGKDGEQLSKNETSFDQLGGQASTLTIEINDTGGGSGEKGLTGPPGPRPKYSKEQIEEMKARRAKIEPLVAKVQEAYAQKNWPAAETALRELIAADPERWGSYQALGNTQFNLGKYQEAVQTYEIGIQKAQKTPSDPQDPTSDPSKIKAGIGQMLTQQGNAYLKLGKTNEAVAAFTKAAPMNANPAIAYYNLCVVLYNTGQLQDVGPACDKAIAADPKRPDAYFIKARALYENAKTDASGKHLAPAGTIEALKKYLDLVPDGPHATEAKLMLEGIAAPN